MSEPTERMTIVKQIRLSPDHRAMPYQITRASNGDLIIFGSTDDMDHRPWATRVAADGEVRWEFVGGGPNGWTDRTYPGQRFYSAVELPDQATLLCGIKVVDKENLVVLNRLAANGALVAERLIRPQIEKRHLQGATCIRWNGGIALTGAVFGLPSGTGWLAVLDDQLNVEWEKFGDQYVSTQVMQSPGGGIFILALPV